MFNSSFYILFAETSSFSAIIPFIVGLITFKFFDKALLFIFILVSISVILEIINYVLANAEINNYSLMHFFSVIEFSLILNFFIQFYKKIFKSAWLLLLIPVFIVIAYIDYRINSLNSLDNFSVSIEAIILSTCSLFTFYLILNKGFIENILKTPVFWINTGILLYFSGNLIFFVFINYLSTYNKSGLAAIWAIHSGLNIIYNLFITIGLWKARVK